MPNLTRSSSVEESISSLADILLSSPDCPVDDLTEQLQAMDKYPFAGGGYSDVYKYRARSSLPEGRHQGIKVFAVKAANAKLCVGERRKSMKKLRREFEVWASLQHKNVMELHGVIRRDGNPYPCLVSDFMENGTALEYLRKKPEANLIHLICDIAKGLAYLHGKDVVHGDLKENNVLVGSDGRARLADFGLSRMLGPDGLALEVSTSDGDRNSRWTAIEYFDFSGDNVPPQGPTKKGDIWSLGCTILQLFSGEFPFYDSRNAAVTIRLSRGQSPSFPPDALKPDFEKYRKGITAYCQLCWVKNPMYRPGINVLEPIICSYCAEAGCDDPGPSSGPSPNSDEASYHDLGNTNTTNGERIDSPNGLRSESSLGATTADSRDEEYFQEPFSTEPHEIPSAFPHVNQSRDADTSATAPGPSIPLFEIPPPPPPSVDSMLHHRYKSAQAILKELCEVRTGFRIAYEDGGSTGPAHVRTHVIICFVNDEQYGIGRIQGTKKQAKERAAIAALGQLYLEHPEYFPVLRYLPILQSHLRTNDLTHRVSWTEKSGPDPQDPAILNYSRTFSFDGSPVATGTGNTNAMAEESAARIAASVWQQAFASSAWLVDADHIVHMPFRRSRFN